MSDALMHTYARADLAFERGEGPYLYTADGRRFLDFAAGIAVNSLGHSHPHLVKALQEQGAKLWHTSNLYQIPEGRRLAERLVANSFADQVFFCNSGAEAIEGALKIARRCHYAQGHPEKMRVISCTGAFHGRTLTTLSAAANPKYLEGCGPTSEGFDQVPVGNMNELRNAIRPETGAILVEPIQGEGGIRAADLDYLRALRNVCDEYGLLLVLDEPTSALDVSVQAVVLQLLDRLKRELGMSYIFVSHDLNVVRAMSHEVAVMKDGDIVEMGSAADIFERPQTAYAQTLLSAALDLAV